MIAFLSRNIIATLLIGALIVGGAWYFFFADRRSEELLTTTSAVEAEKTVEKGIVDTLLTLRAVSLSGTIFSDPAFISLRDFGSEIVPETTGRINPFAPRDTETSEGTKSGTPTIRPQP